MYRRLLAESVGVFFLLFVVGVSNGEPFAVGGALWCIMVLTGFTSNAVFNPAMSVSFVLKFYLRNTLTREIFFEYCLYTILQFIFAIVGSFAAWSVLQHTVHFSVTDGYMVAETFFGEVIYTSMIACNAHVMGKFSENKIVCGGVVAMTVTSGIWAIGKISGACFNPAVALSVNLVTYINGGQYMGHTWIYFGGPIVGAIIGTYFSEYFGEGLEEKKKFFEEVDDEDELTINLE